MKALLSSLLVGALLVLSGSTVAAQRVAAAHYRGPGSYVSSRVWVPGHYETVSERVWIPGACQRVWVEPVHEWRLTLRGFRYVCVREGHWRTVELPGHYEIRLVNVWQPGRWVARGSCR